MNIKPAHRKYYLILFGAWLVYAGLTLLAPIGPASLRYGISPNELHLVQLTIVLPILAIWILGLRGAVLFRDYAQAIRHEADGKALGFIASGLIWLVIYLTVPAIIGALAPYFRDTPNIAWVTIIRTHLTMLTALVAFLLIYIGSTRLNDLIKVPTWNTGRIFALLMPYGIFAIAFTWLFFNNPNIQQATTPNATATFFLPPSVVLVTIVLPYIAMWLIGLIASVNIRHYANEVRGSIYRHALGHLVFGLMTVILFTITLQLLGAASGVIAQLGLGAILILVYILFILDAVGFMYIASGARKLAKIEAVQ